MSLGNPVTICRRDSDVLPADLTGVHPPIRSIPAGLEQQLRLLAKFSLTRLRQYRHSPHSRPAVCEPWVALGWSTNGQLVAGSVKDSSSKPRKIGCGRHCRGFASVDSTHIQPQCRLLADSILQLVIAMICSIAERRSRLAGIKRGPKRFAGWNRSGRDSSDSGFKIWY